MNLALFDLDNTLLCGDSDYEWAQFLINRGILERDTYEAENLRFYEQYKAGTLDIYEFLDFQLAPLARHTPDQLAHWHQDFMRERILPIVLDKGRVLVAAHKSSGDLCAIITATAGPAGQGRPGRVHAPPPVHQVPLTPCITTDSPAV